MSFQVLSALTEQLACPHCSQDHNVVAPPNQEFQATVNCRSCGNPFGVVATPRLMFQTVISVEDQEVSDE